MDIAFKADGLGNESNPYFSNLSPNPSSDITSIQYKLPNEQKGIIELYNSYGQLLKTSEISGEGVYSILCQDYKAGLYFVKSQIVDGSTISIQKLIIQ